MKTWTVHSSRDRSCGASANRHGNRATGARNVSTIGEIESLTITMVWNSRTTDAAVRATIPGRASAIGASSRPGPPAATIHSISEKNAM